MSIGISTDTSLLYRILLCYTAEFSLVRQQQTCCNFTENRNVAILETVHFCISTRKSENSNFNRKTIQTVNSQHFLQCSFDLGNIRSLLRMELLIENFAKQIFLLSNIKQTTSQNAYILYEIWLETKENSLVSNFICLAAL